MNYARILLGGLAGGVAFNIVAIAINLGCLMKRYAILQSTGVLRLAPRGMFMPGWLLMLFAVSIGCVWLYAAVRPRLGAGPKTALTIGLFAGLLCAVPLNYSTFAWGYTGGFLALGWTAEIVLGCLAATLVGGWLYRE